MLSLVLSTLGHALGAVAAIVLASALDIEVSWLMIGFLACLVVVVTTLPISIGGWGVRELTFLTLLTPLGVSDPQAITLGFLLGVTNLVVALPGGLWLLRFGRIKVQDAKELDWRRPAPESLS